MVKNQSYFRSSRSVVYTGFLECGVPGAIGRGFFLRLEKAKNTRFLILENFQKMLKNQCKSSNFWKTFREILQVFENPLKVNRNFREKLGKNLEIFSKSGLIMSSGGEDPGSLRKSSKISREINGKLQN